MERVLVSACLLGEPVRYHGRSEALSDDILTRWVEEGRVVTLCPEVRADLGVPRPPAEIIGANGFAVLDGFAAVLDKRGIDITTQMVAGAQEMLQLAQSFRIRVAVLKDGSPSCGRTYIYNGQFRGLRKRGEVGVTAALLKRNGIAVFSENQIAEAEKRVRELEMVRRMGAG